MFPHPACPVLAFRDTPTRVFWQKRLQAVENKGNECRKERKETTRRLQVSENMGFAIEAQRH